MMYIIITAVILIGVFIVFQPDTKQYEYNAQFGNEWEFLSRFNHGWAVTGSRSVTKKIAHENCLLLGPTGSGKTQVVILNSVFSIASGGSSMVINDMNGEICESTSGYLYQEGYKILIVDFSDSAVSEGFNPLLNCKTISDIQKIALIIILNTMGEAKGDPFWHTSSSMLLSLFIRYVVFHCEEKYRTLHNVLRLIQKFAADGKAVDRLFVRTKDSELLDEYKSTLVVGEKTLLSIIASTRAALNLWLDKEICRTTYTNTIDFEILRKEKVAVFVKTPLIHQTYFKPLTALFFQTLFMHVMSRRALPTERSVFIILDEAAVCKFPELSTTVSNIRKSAGLLLCMQDEMSLIAQYGQAEAHNIQTNCQTKVYLRGQPLHTCQKLCALMGKTTLETPDGKKVVKDLMTVDEIHICDQALIFIANNPPLRCKTTPLYQNMWLRHRTKIPPFINPRKECIEPPMIEFV